ncbi:carboxylating nicotinate-nucleotide diphosphorylase [Merismopedia glauca]|uniref:Probable nicotinate-nucleotide pyrophosphorylase [carboxylating] n=1 Tax=Merismopedia glauca CCAP 1448/3 TaxID=1296344 RepID=A0A2T1BY77_9CYAN|nr:carboxylating nicotinate-nucleotide diphosphorylase [Merismopedia glauca]PSB00877.1 nicotinate-nucleotide diphosphorylase (carboxylating) [Merismopedia glauca CCAP 1448/3]
MVKAFLPPLVVLDPLLTSWLIEDIGRGDRATQGLEGETKRLAKAQWVAKQSGVICGLPIASRIFQLLDRKVDFCAVVAEGEFCDQGEIVAKIQGNVEPLLMGERVALNLAMRLSGVATLTRQYVDAIADLPAKLVDTRKTTPGLRLLEKYATQVGGGINHRFGLDDAAMIKDNHIAAAGGISAAVSQIRSFIPYPLTIEVETSNLEEVEKALEQKVDIIMLDNMSIEMMQTAVKMIRQQDRKVNIEASGNVTLETIRQIATTGVDYISSSAPITRSTWLDLSMNLELIKA